MHYTRDPPSQRTLAPCVTITDYEMRAWAVTSGETKCIASPKASPSGSSGTEAMLRRMFCSVCSLQEARYPDPTVGR